MNNKQKRTIILLLGALTAIGPFSIDMYLPGFPAIADSLHTDIAHVTLSLTSYFAGISIGQLLYGPLIDRFGRKKPLLIGLAIYFVAAIGCMLSPDIFVLIGMRLLLALGGCVGMVVGRAVVRDLFPASESAKIFSSLILIMGIAPIVAPSIGSFFCSHIGWRFIFVFLAAFSALLFISVSVLLPESKGPDHTVSLKFKHILVGYKEILQNKEFLVYAFGGSFVWAGLYGFISGSSFVYMKIFGFSEKTYGLLFALNACGLIIGSQLNRQLLKRLSSQKVVTYISQLLLGNAILLIGSNFINTPIWAFIVIMFFNLFCLGFMNPNATALALSPFKRNAGSASAMIGFVQLMIGAGTSAVISVLHNGTAQPMTMVMAGGSIIGFTIFVISPSVLKKSHQH